MKKTFVAVCCLPVLVFLGCVGSDPPTPADREGRDADGRTALEEPASSQTSGDADPPADQRGAAAGAAGKYSPEQMARAKQLAAELGVLLEEDGDGNVIRIDTAANRSWANDDELEQMLVLPQRKSLTVEGPDISDQLAPRIAEFEQLEFFASRNTLIGDQGIAQLAKLPSLKIIDLRVSPMVTDAAMETLATMPSLRAVRVSDVNISDQGIESLMALPQLTELDIRNCRAVTKQGIQRLAEKGSLRNLKLGGPKIGDDVLEVVATMENLTSLSLENCSITDAGVAKLDELPLEHLTLYQTPNVTDEGLAVLASLNSLRTLTLRDVGARGTALAELPSPEKLVELNLALSRITDAEVVHLVGLTSLETLILSETALTDAAIDTLSKMGSLKRLVLNQTRVTEAGAERVRDALPECRVEVN
jgi:hypothetical protein